jgi:hypothetical protein
MPSEKSRNLHEFIDAWKHKDGSALQTAFPD